MVRVAKYAVLMLLLQFCSSTIIPHIHVLDTYQHASTNDLIIVPIYFVNNINVDLDCKSSAIRDDRSCSGWKPCIIDGKGSGVASRCSSPVLVASDVIQDIICNWKIIRSWSSNIERKYNGVNIETTATCNSPDKESPDDIINPSCYCTLSKEYHEERRGLFELTMQVKFHNKLEESSIVEYFQQQSIKYSIAFKMRKFAWDIARLQDEYAAEHIFDTAATETTTTTASRNLMKSRMAKLSNTKFHFITSASSSEPLLTAIESYAPIVIGFTSCESVKQFKHYKRVVNSLWRNLPTNKAPLQAFLSCSQLKTDSVAGIMWLQGPNRKFFPFDKLSNKQMVDNLMASIQQQQQQALTLKISSVIGKLDLYSLPFGPVEKLNVLWDAKKPICLNSFISKEHIKYDVKMVHKLDVKATQERRVLVTEPTTDVKVLLNNGKVLIYSSTKVHSNAIYLIYISSVINSIVKPLSIMIEIIQPEKDDSNFPLAEDSCVSVEEQYTFNSTLALFGTNNAFCGFNTKAKMDSHRRFRPINFEVAESTDTTPALVEYCTIDYPKRNTEPEMCFNSNKSSKQFREVDFSQAGFFQKLTNKVPKAAPECPFDTFTKTKILTQSACEIAYMHGAIKIGDFNNDGLFDVFYSQADGIGALLTNNYARFSNASINEPMFMDVTEAYIEPHHKSKRPFPGFGTLDAKFVDVDNDGDMDLYVLSLGKHRHRHHLYINNQNNFSEEAIERGVSVATSFPHGGSAIAVGDFDADGYPDIYVAEWMATTSKHSWKVPSHQSSHNRLFRNLGEQQPGYFVDVTEESGISPFLSEFTSHFILEEGDYTFSAAFADMDGDAYVDLVLSADFGTSRIYWNNANGTFTEANPISSGISKEENGMGSAIIDLDRDGNLDWFVSSVEHDETDFTPCTNSLSCSWGFYGNRFYKNNGNRTFSEIAAELNIRKSKWAWGAEFFDFDNDGDLDLFVSNGFIMYSTTAEDQFNFTPNTLFVNNGSNYFDENAEKFGLDSTARVIASSIVDFDNDGDLDIVSAENGGYPVILENTLIATSGDYNCANSFLRVRVLADYGSDLLNARVELLEIKKDLLLAVVNKEERVALLNSLVLTDYRIIGVTQGHFQSQSEPVAHFGLGAAVKSDVSLVVKVCLPHTWATCIYAINLDPNQMVVLTVNPRATNNNTIVIDASKSKITCNIFAAATDSAKQHISQELIPSIANEWANCYQLDEEKAVISGESLIPVINDALSSSSKTKQSYDGTMLGNNKGKYINSPSHLIRLFPSFYEDGENAPSGSNRPSARLISNAIFNQNGINIPTKRNLSELFVTWGQFLAHDISLSNALGAQMRSSAKFLITIPKGDTYFDIEATGRETMRFTRTDFINGTNKHPREQVNLQTSFIDGSNIYGSSAKRNNAIRQPNSALLKTVNNCKLGPMVPKNPGTEECDNPIGRKATNLYLTGDHRGNETPPLLALHVIFVREHNFWARTIGNLHPELSHDDVYHAARRIVISELQHITYAEYLPKLLHKQYLPECNATLGSGDSGIYNSFATAAFRFGHSATNSRIMLKLRKEAKITVVASVSLLAAFFQPELGLQHSLEALLQGQISTVSQEVDSLMVEELRSTLFGTPRSGGLDLAAANIQRGRDHGLPDYNTARRLLNLPPISSFNEISSNVALCKQLESSIYGTVDNVDLFVGGLAEDHVAGSSLGETFSLILQKQFDVLCIADPFYYKTVFNRADYSLFSLKSIIERNSNLTGLSDVFLVSSS